MKQSTSIDEKIILDLGNFKQNWKTIENPRKKTKNETKKNKIWFDVDHIFIPESDLKTQPKQETKSIASSQTVVEPVKVKLTKAIAIDCEMVGVGDDSRESILARVSLVNQLNQCVYDKYVIPRESITDYRTHVSGIRLDDLKKENGAVEFSVVQKEVAEIIKDRKLVGHALHNDLKVLFLSHPKKKIRDTQRCKLFRKKYPSLGSLASLKTLANVLLGLNIQTGEHNSVQDAQCAMRIYTMFRKDWENEINGKYSKKSKEANTEILLNYTNPNDVDVKQGNSKHKRHVVNKIKRRNKFLNKK